MMIGLWADALHYVNRHLFRILRVFFIMVILLDTHHVIGECHVESNEFVCYVAIVGFGGVERNHVIKNMIAFDIRLAGAAPGLKVGVVHLERIYVAFSSGEPILRGLQSFQKHFVLPLQVVSVVSVISVNLPTQMVFFLLERSCFLVVVGIDEHIELILAMLVMWRGGRASR